MSKIAQFVGGILNLSRTGPDDALIIDPYSIGDVFQTMSLLDGLKQLNKFKRINVLCLTRTARVLSFFENFDGLYHLDSVDEMKFSILAQTKWYELQKNIFIMPPDMHVNYSHSFNMYGCAVINYKKKILGLPNSFKPILPRPRSDVKRRALDYAEKIGLSSNSLIIFNHAQTIQPLNIDVFFPMLSLFPDKVYFDSWGGAPKSWGKSIDIPLEFIPFLCDIAGNVICLRSGITEILSLSSARIFTIYPGSRWMADWFVDKKNASDMFRTWGIRDLGLNLTSLETKVFVENNESTEDIGNKLCFYLMRE